MIWYFRKNLKPSIWAGIEQRDCKLDSLKELIKKTKDIKVKTTL